MGEEHIPGGQPDFSALLGNLLQNPAAITMLSSLLSGGINGKGGAPHPPPSDACESSHNAPSPPPLPAPKPPPADKRTCLLNALRPYLSPSRCDTVDSLLRILELMELLRKRR